MESKIINSLVERYFEGETTLEEEMKLRAYFQSTEVEADLKKYQPLFQFYAREKELSLSENFEEKFENALQPSEKQAVVRNINFRLVRIAATLLLLIGGIWLATFLINNSQKEPKVDWTTYEIDDPELALQETMKALALVSNKFKTAEETTEKNIASLKRMDILKAR